MKIGDLVEITRASVGVPTGTIALIISVACNEIVDPDDPRGLNSIPIYIVWPTGEVGKRGSRRYLSRDLEVISRPLKSKLHPQTTLKTS